jgi:ParB-like chromosome segregation protein Spo0J
MMREREDDRERSETKFVGLEMIETDPAIEARIEPTDRRVLQAIVWSIRNRTYPPPILLYHVKYPDGFRYILVDGRARVAAVKATGGTEIVARIEPGTLAQAAWAAAAANSRPEQPRTNDEVRRAIELALEASPKAQDETVANHVGCTVGMIRKARQRLRGE